MTINSQQSTVNSRQVVVVGGGLAGLISATLAAKAGAPVLLLEKSSALGGRAATREKHGFFFNRGPHALYRLGALRGTLQSLGIEPTGGVPGVNGGFAVYQGRLQTLPVGFVSLMTTGILGLPAKLEFAKLLSTLGTIDAASAQRDTLTAWLKVHVRHERVRALLRMLVRVATFTNDPDRQSAGAALEQLQLAARGNVLYLDGGWQTIVEALRRAAIQHGVQIRTTAPVVGLDRPAARRAAAVRLADGSVVPAASIILAATPADVDAIAATSFASTLRPPVRVATLDLGLRLLPNPKHLVAFGVDAAVYFSVHSAVARLAPPGGAVVHVSKYLRPDEQADHEVEGELERFVDLLQPGWRDAIDVKQFLPNLVVTNAEITADRGGVPGRPVCRLPMFDNVFIAGDWVGPHGQLSDAAAASAKDAADAAALAPVVQAFRPASVA